MIDKATTIENLIEICAQTLNKVELELQTVKYRIRIISLLRILLFMAAATACIAYIMGIQQLYLQWIAVGCVLAFVILVKRHDFWYRKKRRLEIEIELNKLDCKNLQGDYSAQDSGREYIDTSHLYTYDLDIFGDRSLFQCVNRTCTDVGKKKLAGWFNRHLIDKAQIEHRQELVRELSKAMHFIDSFRIECLVAAEDSWENAGRTGNKYLLPLGNDDWVKWAESIDTFAGKWYYKYLSCFTLSVNILLFALAFAGIISFTIPSMVVMLLALWSINFSRKITHLQDMYGHRLQALSQCAPMIALIEKETELHSMEWQRISGLVRSDDMKASQVISRLHKLMNALDRRNNVMVTFVLNGLCFWEIYRMVQIENWKRKYAIYVPSWIEALTLLDAYGSMALFSHTHPDCSFPEIVSSAEDKFVYTADNLGHPLMNPKTCIGNSVRIEERPYFLIVTGANMAGKSTYLRTVAVNYLLACMGMPVCGEKMHITPVILVTSLRTTDSLVDNESYFFAELKRLKLIIDMLQEGKQLFIILDEILRGTNSIDKQKGSLALLKQLLALRANGIIATHDLQLGKLIEYYPNQVSNFCFEADITDNELHFSYEIREGVAQNMNACFLMKKMGIAVAD